MIRNLLLTGNYDTIRPLVNCGQLINGAFVARGFKGSESSAVTREMLQHMHSKFETMRGFRANESY